MLETIKKLDIFPRQVLVEVLIAEVALDDSWQFGVTWQLKSQGNLTVDGEDYYFDSDARLNGSASPTAAGFTCGIFEATRFQGLLNAFANDAKLIVLSSPQITASNNTEASIEVADEVPIPVSVCSSGTGGGTPSTTPINTSIQYRDTGVILKVKPRITESQFVTLEVAQEVSEQVAKSNIGGTEAPTIQKRKVQTSVAMRADETLIFDGLIRTAAHSGSGGIPWLQRIPILGRLLSSKSVSNRRTGLIIMITPHIVDELSGPQLTEAAREDVPAVDRLIEGPQQRKWWRP
ncbi:MAG: hypothetical protein HYV63_00320 [Candidatus Schekmanbacteria bacterium]|nr:hypothetical protein [Candidatus Schekmanbacteria bacterium]